MASNRINRINEEIQKSLAGKLRTVKDPRVSGTMISITRVETTPDLRYAKVYVSFLEENKAKDAMKGLQSAGGYLRREAGYSFRGASRSSRLNSSSTPCNFRAEPKQQGNS